ncbi:RrF2 family transcriptional regulator [Paenibacillus agricola]|uniref:Rrf2 family transcriptional regulator n=1 Tax=Paenibacillus agricola TaxID=2716264 RepID=A0ABX0IWF4_9BACL|nr:Rrf2 family transcriptional regulator [Paenibacillus agricola]NHN28237.1 Rrf2 family transcriptional regulator [Paenibacillus agricola]
MTKIKHTYPPNCKTFGLALQALVVMAKNPNRCPSGDIADYLCSEATLIRRIMAKLAQEHILEAREGRDGGYRLKLPPESITFADIFLALQVGESMCEGMLESTGDHPLGLQMHDVFSDMVTEMKQSMLDILKQHTIAELANGLMIKRD